MSITAKTKICLIIGDPVEHSLSPKLHNSGYKELGISSEFVFVAAHVKPSDLSAAIVGIRALNIRGIAITIPHKQSVIKNIDQLDESAISVGAVNTIVNDNGVLTGFNTDWLGVVKPLEERINLKGKKVAVLGAGGAARAAVYGAMKYGAIVKLFNRTLDKASKIADEMHCEFGSISSQDEISNFDIIINSTSVGMAPDINSTIIDSRYIRRNHIIFDMVYKPRETRLMKESRDIGAKTIEGIEMLLHQGVAQFELFTKRAAPIEVMRKVLTESL